jgi:hypothetical protein
MKNFCLSEERKSTDKGKITLNTMMISISLTDFGLGTYKSNCDGFVTSNQNLLISSSNNNSSYFLSWPTRSDLRCAYYGRNKAQIFNGAIDSANLKKSTLN